MYQLKSSIRTHKHFKLAKKKKNKMQRQLLKYYKSEKYWLLQIMKGYLLYS